MGPCTILYFVVLCTVLLVTRWSSGQRTWNENSVTAVRILGRATIPLGSNLGQVVYTHCLPSFSAPRVQKGVFGA